MPTLNLTEEQVIQLLEQLPLDRKTDILMRFARDAARLREQNLQKGEEQMRRIAAQRGLEWEKLNDDERLALVDELIHEDRRCGP